jgi:hypothetical protein
MLLVLLAQPLRVDAGVRARGRVAEPGAGEELPGGALAASGDAGDLAGAVSLAGEVAELLGAGWLRLGLGQSREPGGKPGRRARMVIRPIPPARNRVLNPC